MTLVVVVMIMAYILGSIPSAYVAGRLLRGIDIRAVGDGNMGAANTAREVGLMAGMAVAAVDVAKGMGVVVMARQAALSQFQILVIGLVVVMGHMWPILLHFHGGRGAATTLGVLFALLPGDVLVLGLLAAIPFLITRNTTVALGIIFGLLPFVAWWAGRPGMLVSYSVALPVIVALRHFWTVRRFNTITPKEASPGRR